MSVRAFEFVPVIESIQLMGEKVKTKIECIECCGGELYVGTSDSFIVLYVLEEKHHTNGKVSYDTKMVRNRYLDQRKPIKCMKAASALSRILVLSDTNLLLLSMPELDIIEGGSKLRAVNTFCLNENPDVDDPFCMQICVARKRQIHVYNVTDDKLVHVKDISIPEPAIAVAADGYNICVALSSQYIVYNFSTNTMQKLFPYKCENFLPVIRRIMKEEFLLSSDESLGMFVCASGVSNRPPIQWSYPLLALAYSHPYVIGLSDEVIMVYSILDQQQKQALPFVGGRTIGNFDGRIYVSSATAVYSLAAIPWTQQVEVLLQDGRVDEALELAENVNRVGMTKQESQHILHKIQQKAGFIYFSNGDFEKALELFEMSLIDIREVISLFPHLLPPSTNFVRAVPPLHGIADINQLFHGDESKLIEAKRFLRRLLEDMRQHYRQWALEVDTSLLKLYSEVAVTELEELIATGEMTCDIKDCCDWLESRHCYHALALLYRHAKQHDKALRVWASIISGEYKDDSFHGLDFFVECLANLEDHTLVWKFADFVLGHDELVGVGIFTLRSPEDLRSDSMKPDTVVNFLHRYPKAVIKYLEYLVIDRNIEIEKFHTHLAVLYLDGIIRLKGESNETEILELRSKLQILLQKSNLYRIQLLISKTKDAELHQETAVLYGKTEEHEKALQILVYCLKDFKAAEMYCVQNSEGKSLDYRHSIFHTLLGVYLKPRLKSEDRSDYLIPAIELLNRRAADFDAAHVLSVIPSNWSISVINLFLRGALRTSLHKYRMKKIECALSRGENLNNRLSLYNLCRQSVPIHENNYCCVCKKPFSDGSFARYPNDVLTHTACAAQSSICPLTGKNFKSFPCSAGR